MDIELVTNPYACMVHIVSPLAGLGGGILAAYSLFDWKMLKLTKNALTRFGDYSNNIWHGNISDRETCF